MPLPGIFFTYLLLLARANVACLASAAADRRFWITKATAPSAERAVESLALIVKDEELVGTDCLRSTTEEDRRYSDKRHLMCAGSILTSRHILTSASCLYEATHIRHNIRAPLAVMVAPFSNTTQVIKVSSYLIHPKYQVDPRADDYAVHNVAIINLSCRIPQRNLKEIELPTQSFRNECEEEACFVPIIKKTDQSSYTLYEALATNASLKSSHKIRIAREIPNKVASSSNNLPKVLKVDKNPSPIQVREASNENNSASSENIDAGNENLNKKNCNFTKRIANQGSDRTTKLDRRTTAIVRGCPKVGSPVMHQKVQAGLVAVSCDERQPDTVWHHTDIFANVGWIRKMIGSTKLSNDKGNLVCYACIYNFFVNYNCKENSGCRKYNSSEISQLNIELPNFGSNKPKISINRSKFKLNDSIINGPQKELFQQMFHNRKQKRNAENYKGTLQGLNRNNFHDEQEGTVEGDQTTK